MKIIRFAAPMFVFAVCCVLFSCRRDGAEIVQVDNREADSLRNELAEREVHLQDIEEIMAMVTQTIDSINLGSKSFFDFDKGEGGRRPTRADIRRRLDLVTGLINRQRQQLRTLEQRLVALNDSSSTHSSTIASLQSLVAYLESQIDAKNREIADIRRQLSDSRVTITQLTASLDQMTERTDSLTQSNETLQQTVTQQEDVINECYVLIADKQSLKNLGILQGGGFLRKTKTDLSKINKSMFSAIDARYVTTIDIPSSKAKLITPAPQGSYRLQKQSGGKYRLDILNAKSFWSVSNYLIIQTD